MKIIKPVLVYIVSFGLLFIVIHFSQQFIIQKLNTPLKFKSEDVNTFFAIASFIICFLLHLLSYFKELKPNIGFMYLPTLFIKGILFFIIFKSSVFTLETFTMTDRVNILIPSLLFLLLEVIFVAKIIDSK